MTLQAFLALVDAAAGAYLVVYALRRERRDKPAVLVTGLVLLLCAAALAWLAVPAAGPSVPPPAPGPAGTLT